MSERTVSRFATTLRGLRDALACTERYVVLRKALGPNYGDSTPVTMQQILASNGLDDCLWAIFHTQNGAEEKLLRLFACDCAERVLVNFTKQFPDDKRVADCIAVARRFALGEATAEDLAAAESAALAAAGAAARAAAESAAAAAWAAESAALAAAESAAAAARAAAWAAAGAAAAAAWAAARAAARAAAWAAAGAAAESAEIEWQTNRLRELLDGAA